MEIDIRTLPEFQFTLSDEELAILRRLSTHHYDAKCKAASQATGFLYRWERNHITWKECGNPDGLKELIATSDDMQTCLKIMEMPEVLLENAGQVRVLRNLRKHFFAVLHKANEGYSEWRYDYVGKDRR